MTREQRAQLRALGFAPDYTGDCTILVDGEPRYVLWTPYDRERRWTADLIPESGVADPRHPRFDDPIVAAIWIKTELGL